MTSGPFESFSSEGRARDRLLIIAVLVSMPLVAFPRFGPLKAIDFALVLLTVRSFGSSRFVIPSQIVAITALVGLWTAVAFFGGNLRNLHQIGDWSVGLESMVGYPFVAAFRICTAAIGMYELIRLSLRDRVWVSKAASYTLISVTTVSILLWLTGPGRDVEGRPKGTFTERGPFSRYLIAMCALVLFLQIRRRIPFSIYFAVALAASTGALSGALLLGFFGGVYVAREARRRLHFASVAPVMVALVFLGALAPIASPLIMQKVASLRRAREAQLGGNGRYAALLIVEPVVRSAPWIGYGTGSYIFVRDSEEFGLHLARIPHDNADVPVIELLVDHGLLGGGVFLALLLVGPFRRIRRGNWPWFALLCASLLTGTTVTYLLWLAFAMAMQRGDADATVRARSHRVLAISPGPVALDLPVREFEAASRVISE